jgi:hypothetical protein
MQRGLRCLTKEIHDERVLRTVVEQVFRNTDLDKEKKDKLFGEKK